MAKVPPQIKVVLIDDSSVIRGALAKLLEEDPSIKIVGTAANGENGITVVQRQKPHIVMLDIEMPVMDGLTALPQILKASPDTKVIMFSALTEQGASTTMKAMSLGAVECVVKPRAGEAKSGTDFHISLLRKIKALVPLEERVSGLSVDAAPQPVKKHLVGDKTHAPTGGFELRDNKLDFQGKPKILAIGSSTGGPQALFNVTKHLKGLNIPIVITQHMPATFTKILAEHITQQSGLECREGENGMLVEAGKAYLAPGGFHMIFEHNDNGQTVIKLDTGPAENFCKPAVDVMLRSLQKLYGNKVLTIIMTGMGQDGLAAGQILVGAGARLIAQDEDTSVVWGMPGAVAKAGICTAVLPLNDIGPWIQKAVT